MKKHNRNTKTRSKSSCEKRGTQETRVDIMSTLASFKTSRSRRHRRFRPAATMKRLSGCNGSNNSTHTSGPHVSCESPNARLSRGSHRRRPATRRRRPSCRLPHPKGRLADGFVIGHGTEGNTASYREERVHIHSRCCPVGTALAIGCWYTSLLPVLSCPPSGEGGGREM